jgi:hypothetical protein
VPRSLRLLLTLCAIALLAPAAAHAQTQQPAAVALDGDPLNVYTTPDGSIQVNVEGAPLSEFYPQSAFDPNTSQSIPSQIANAGFGIMVDTGPQTSGTSYGRFIAGGMPDPESGPTLTQPGTLTTTWVVNDSRGTPALRIVQVLEYVNGQRQVDASFNVSNITNRAVPFRANVAGDLAIRGSDSGIGFVIGAAPTRFIGGLNQAVGAAGGFVEATPWTSFETNTLGNVGSNARDSSGPGFDNSVSTEEADNAAGVQWDQFFTNGLPPGQNATFNVGLRFVDTLGLDPISANEQVGDQHVVKATATDINGQQLSNQRLDYTVDGANPLTGNVTTDSDGKAQIAWVGGNAGTDTLTVFVDQNKNGTRDENEPQSLATVEWQGEPLPPPVIGETAGVKPVSGKVKIKLPKGTSSISAKRMGLRGAATKFQPLTNAARIPVGSTLDTTRGTVQLLTAGSKPSATTGVSTYQSGNFKNGQFRIGQNHKNPLMQLSMTGGGLTGCKTKPSKGGAARTRSRRLFGSAHGHFRTRGRHSSATVRGTQWSMTDSCAGTLTVVKQGTVTVRDFTLRKTKKVKAGHRYFAKAPKLKKRRH